MRRAILVAGILVAAALGAGLAYSNWERGHAFLEGLIQVNGRVEGDLVTVSSKFPGRIAQLMAREGDSVHKGQILVRINDPQTNAKRDQAEAELRAVIAQEQGAGAQVNVTTGTTNSQILQARAVVNQAETAIMIARADAARSAAAMVTAAATSRSAGANIGTAQATLDAAAANKAHAVAGLQT